jgi:hypothetical protein
VTLSLCGDLNAGNAGNADSANNADNADNAEIQEFVNAESGFA